MFFLSKKKCLLLLFLSFGSLLSIGKAEAMEPDSRSSMPADYPKKVDQEKSTTAGLTFPPFLPGIAPSGFLFKPVVPQEAPCSSPGSMPLPLSQGPLTPKRDTRKKSSTLSPPPFPPIFIKGLSSETEPSSQIADSSSFHYGGHHAPPVTRSKKNNTYSTAESFLLPKRLTHKKQRP